MGWLVLWSSGMRLLEFHSICVHGQCTRGSHASHTSAHRAGVRITHTSAHRAGVSL